MFSFLLLFLGTVTIMYVQYRTTSKRLRIHVPDQIVLSILPWFRPWDRLDNRAARDMV